MSLTIREVVKLTGVEAPTLRMWEQRHGFPSPERLPSGHRRYSQEDVELIKRVMRDRAAGLELRAAIESAQRTAGDGGPPAGHESIFAGLRHRKPRLSTHLLSKRTLVGLSRAIEDECSASAERPVLFASFQRERFYRQSESSWRDLAKCAHSAIVMADFKRVRRRRDHPVEVPISLSDPIGREWSLVCDAPDFTALLSAWERPGQDDIADADRTFETMWSVEPELVREAASLACAMADRASPGVTGDLSATLERPVRAGDQLDTTLRLTNRMLAYVGEGVRP